MKKLDIKSTLIGFLTAACLFLLIGSDQPENNNKSRYQIIKSEGFFVTVMDTYAGSIVQIATNSRAPLIMDKDKAYIPGKKVREILEME